ncbi:hypothetical protein J2S76_000346 [Ancylobacter vacuolatus]|uniref:Uncharacterized protein n=1 Tax=Ancylobacter vacuolatus TaxID=223389 RepID=A0ABU0DC11_9HYPH|nr:hypothetical protein [Ancylobacter vacuolatus]
MQPFAAHPPAAIAIGRQHFRDLGMAHRLACRVEFEVLLGDIGDGDIQVDQGFVDRMKKAPGLTLQVANAVGRLISYPIGLGDFAKVYDGPQTDQKVFEAQIAKIQEQVKARQEALKTQAEQREQQTKAGLEKLGAEKLKNAPAQ